MHLDQREAEELLVKHWIGLSKSPDFLQSALFTATPTLVDLVEKALSTSHLEKEVFQYLSMRFGIRLQGHPGITRITQLEAILPYLKHLSESDIHALWTVCNENLWIEFRKSYLDSHLSENYLRISGISESLLSAELDDMLSRKSHSLLDHWVDRHQENAVPIDEIMETARKWLNNQTEGQAPEMVASIFIHVGRRKDFDKHFSNHKFIGHSAEVITDLEFEIKRRSLS